MATTAFASVTPPSSLVEQARQAAQSTRRSVASQTAYRAMLGQIVEHTAPASAVTLTTRPLGQLRPKAHWPSVCATWYEATVRKPKPDNVKKRRDM